MLTESGKVFDVSDPQGSEAETTAAEAYAEASSFKDHRQVEENAEKEQEAAVQAAAVAKTFGRKLTGEPSTAVDIPRPGTKAVGPRPGDMASEKTNEAVEEGRRDIESIKHTAEGYVQHAKDVSSKVASAAQDYLDAMNGDQAAPATRSADSQTTSNAETGSFVETIRNIVKRASTYFASAAETAQPHIDQAVSAAQNAVGTAGTQGAQGHDVPDSAARDLGVSGGQGKIEPPNSLSGIPSTNAPLESGKKTFDSPYASTTTKVGTEDLGQEEAYLKTRSPVN